ncbi:MAG: hypothetical protein ACRC67_43360 [Inquilinus sp.]|uniref:hypothetical protein n=1 Tax=Inquilinus sp. TaxID=1932117 RepID=UPI003F390347
MPTDAARGVAGARPQLAPQGCRRRPGLDAVLLLYPQGLAPALRAAKRAGAPALEACPFDAAVSPSASGSGYASTFARLGFETVARRIPARPIMRHDLAGIEE